MSRLPGLDPLSAHARRRAVAVLRTRLLKGEQVLQAAAAASGRREGVLAATDKRLLFAAPGLWGGRVQHFAYEGLRRLQVEKGPEGASLALEFAGRTVQFTGLRRDAADAIAEGVRTMTRRYPQKSAEQLRLERMARMVRRGSMSVGEFEWDAVGLLGPPGRR